MGSAVKAVLTAISTAPSALIASYLGATQHPLFPVSLFALAITILYAIKEGTE